MTEQDLMRLQDACSINWSDVELGGVEGLLSEEGACRANHVYVDCDTPSLIVATSIDLSSGEEVFGLTLVRDANAIEKFLKGPFPPSNTPRVLSLKQIGGNEAGEFMRGRKELQVLRRTCKDQAENRLVTVVQEVSITSGSYKFGIRADDAVPMSLWVMWKQPVKGGLDPNRDGSP